MKLFLINLFMTVVFLGCDFITQNETVPDGNAIIYKFKPKKNNTELDTLWVSQTDSTVFKKEEGRVRTPTQGLEIQIRYELIDPKINTYYFIYDEKQQLILAGKYTEAYTYEGATNKLGNFYNSKTYYYKINGKLKTINYTQNGRNFKTESYDSKRRLTEIKYRKPKSGDVEKVEFYKNGKLKKTRIYTSFDNYYTVAADD